MAIDPICKMEVDEKNAKHTSDYKDKKYYFCGADCKTKFDQNPERYVKPLSSGGCCCCGS